MTDAPGAGAAPHAPTLVAFLDASVLYPATLRNLLMHLAVAGVFQARWTDKVQDEWTAALLRDRPDLDAARLAHRRQLMDTYILDARMIGYEHLIDGLVLPDPNDRHVLAGAIHSSASVIVTANLRHFPAAALAAHGIEALHPDIFLRALIEDNADAVVAAVAEHRAALVNPPKTPAEYLAMLELAHDGDRRGAARLHGCVVALGAGLGVQARNHRHAPVVVPTWRRSRWTVEHVPLYSDRVGRNRRRQTTRWARSGHLLP